MLLSISMVLLMLTDGICTNDAPSWVPDSKQHTFGSNGQCIEEKYQDVLTDELKHEFPEAFAIVKQLSQRNYNLEEELAICQSADFDSDSLVAFSAEATSNRSVGHEGTITFDRVIANVGNHFIPLAGLFQCPDDDLYFAMWSLQATSGRVAASLVKEGETVKYGPLTTEVADSPSGTASMSSVLRCRPGNYVWLKAESWPDSDACNSVQAVYSSFAMFKLPVDDEDVKSALTVELSQNMSISSGADVIFDSVLFDKGGDYESTAGEFTCKEDCIYVFVFGGHIASSASSYNIYRNNAREHYGPYLRNRWPDVDDSGTSSIMRLVRCEAGDVITIRPSSSSDFLAHVTYLSAFALPNNDLVAFSAQLSFNIEVINGNTIPFDEVSINEGGRYTPVHAAFGCLDDAYYVFTWSVAPYNKLETFTARLMMGSEEIKAGPQGMKPYSTGNVHTSASTQVVVQCKNATTVYLQAVVASGEIQMINHQFSDFSGFRLNAGDDITR